MNEQESDEIISMCGCGKPLYASRDSNGERIGVCHKGDDEDWHNAFWSGMTYDEYIKSN